MQDEHVHEIPASKIKDLGTIKIKVSHRQYLGSTERMYRDVDQIAVVSEKAIKGQAISHSIG